MQARFATAVLLGFVLVAGAACGGGGGDDTAKLSELEERLTAAEEAARQARVDADAATAQAADEKKRADEAEEDLAEAREDADDAAVDQDALEEAQEAKAEAERRAAQAQEEADRRIEEAEQQADANDRARALIAELMTAANVDNANADSTVMDVTHMPGESVTFGRPNALPAKGSAPSVPGSWRSASYSGPRGAVGTEAVYLYTNIQAPSSKAFWKVHGVSVTAITAADATVSGFGTTAKELYPAQDGTLDGATTNSGADKGRSIGGTYDGYSGTFKCNAECDIAAGQGGTLSFYGTWTFTASLTAKRPNNLAEQDTEFLYFGIWAYEPTDVTAEPDFKWAHGGDSNDSSEDADIGNFDDLTGEATFTGGAIGKYALAKATGRGARSARTGTFTATAIFTADFNTDKISGRITDFKEGGSDLGSDWTVFLGESDSAPADLDAAGATGQAHGAIDGDTATGAWAATLHGSDNPGTTNIDRAKYPASRYPVADIAGVSGWFRANADDDAAIAGAFGAACTTGTMCAR